MRVDALQSLKEFEDLGFIKGHKDLCPECEEGCLCEPFSRSEHDAYEGKLYVRRKKQCRARFNVSDFSVFKGTRLALRDLLRLIHVYGRVNKFRFPLVSDAQSQLHLGRKQIQHVFDSLRYTETVAGKAFCCTSHKLAGAVEGDGHALRKVYVSHGNATFASEVAEATARWKKQSGSKRLPKYWLGHVRIAALKKRNGPVVVAPLPMKLLPPGSAPGVESYSDLQSTDLDKHLGNRSTQLHTDGARAWPRWATNQGKKQLASFHVSHNKHEFAKKVKCRKRPGFVVSGAQCVDRWWQSLEKAVPKTLKVKDRKGGGISERLMNYVYAFVWRSNLDADVDLTRALGSL